MKITAALLAIAAALNLLVWWLAAGANWFTKTAVMKTIVTKDDFGDMVSKDVWVDRFVPGLLDMAAPGAGGLLFVALVLMYLSRKELFDVEAGAR